MWEKAKEALRGLFDNVLEHAKKVNDVAEDWMHRNIFRKLNIKSNYKFLGTTVKPREIVLGTSAVSGLLIIFVLLIRKRKNANLKKKKCMKGLATWTNDGIEGLQVTADLIRPEKVAKYEVLIRVKAAAIDPVDIRVLYGDGQQASTTKKRWLPTIPGRDCAGIVLEVGSKVTTIKPGDKVWGFSRPWEAGLMAEFVILPESQVSRMPTNLTFDNAASLPYVSMLTWQALCVHGGLGPHTTKGKRILVHIGSSACGCLAIQLDKAWGGHVTTTVPTQGLPLVRMMGVDDVIVFSVTDFQDELKIRDKFDVILNTVMCSVLHQLCLNLCSENGHVVSTANTFHSFDSSRNKKLPTFLSRFRQATNFLFKIFFPSVELLKWENITFDKDVLKNMCELIESDQVVPVVEEIFNLNDSIQGFHRIAHGDTVGKTVISFL